MYDRVTVPPLAIRPDRSDSGRMARILRFPLLRIPLLVLAIPVVGTLDRLYGKNVAPRLDEALAPWVDGLEKAAMVVLLLLAYRWLVRLTERRPVHELGRRDALPEFAIGFGLSGLMIVTCVLLIGVFGSYEVVGFHSPGVLAYAFVSTAFYALLEDLLFRAILFRNVEVRLGTWLAIVLVAALFGLLHLGNDNASVSSSVALAVGDLSLAAAFVLTRRIWMVWGVHVGWNFFQEKIFGMANSGYTASDNLIDAAVSGPAWVTGGAFGVENSVPGVLTSIAVGVLLMTWAYRKKQVVPPGWRR
jgi:membrane protease YdiL (CAAX protease family)